MKRLALACLLSFVVLTAFAATGVVPLLERVWLNTDTRTIADNGGGTAATLTLVPKTSYVPITCSDGDGCTVTLSETAARDGYAVTIENRGSNAISMSTSSGVQELTSALSLAQYQTVSFTYMNDRWVETGRSNSVGSVSSTTLCTLANWCQTTATLTDAQIKALPTTPISVISAQGSGYRIHLFAATFSLDSSAGAYTNINGTYADLHILLGTDYIGYGPVDDSTSTPALASITAFFGVASTRIFDVGVPQGGTWSTGAVGYVQNPNYGLKAQQNNAAMMLGIDNNGSGALTGGNAANTMRYTLYWAKEAI